MSIIAIAYILVGMQGVPATPGFSREATQVSAQMSERLSKVYRAIIIDRFGAEQQLTIEARLLPVLPPSVGFARKWAI